jgi:hypothetical protein
MSRKSAKYTKAYCNEVIAACLREFGYPDAAAAHVADVAAWRRAGAEGKPPHGIVGAFADRQLQEIWTTYEGFPA